MGLRGAFDMRLWTTAALAAVACGVHSPAPAARTFTPEPQGIAVVKFMIADDVRSGIFARGKSVGDYSKWTGRFINTTPQQIAADYDRNELSADDKYKEVLIVFSGQITAIRKDAFSNPYIVVETGSMFHEIQASMDDDIATLSRLSKGGNVGLVCKGASYVLLSPILHHCRLENSFIAAEELRAADAAAIWLNGGESPSFLDSEQRRTVLFYIYFVGAMIETPKVCANGMDTIRACAEEIEKEIKSATPDSKKLQFRADFRSAVDAARADLGLSYESLPPKARQ
jgi:hypothetical protein